MACDYTHMLKVTAESISQPRSGEGNMRDMERRRLILKKLLDKCSYLFICISLILISEQIALAAIFYFGQVFVFCMLTIKTVLEWPLLIMCKEHPLTIVTRDGQSGNTGHLNRNLYVMLKFTKRPKTWGMTSKKTVLSMKRVSRVLQVESFTGILC